MKHLFFYSLLALCCINLNTLSASGVYQENMDSLLHKVKGHRQGVVTLDDEGVKLKVYMSCNEKAPNGKLYYRWWSGDFVYSVHDLEEMANDDSAKPLTYGYRFEDNKMYAYNFLTNEESVAYDFTLQPGEEFTTPDGTIWKVTDRRTESFESAFEGQTDYKNEHVVLSVQSLDGKTSDEWVQYIGSLHYPMQTWGRKDIKLSHTAFFNLSENDDKLVLFNFSEDPIYGQSVDVIPGPDAHTELYRNYSITADKDTLKIAINYYTWFTRHYCYTYRNANTLDIHSFELGPYRDGSQVGAPSFSIAFPITTSFDDCNIVYDGEALPTVIDTPQISNNSHSSFDLSGRRISVSSASSVPSVLPKGVYIRDGKKVAVK